VLITCINKSDTLCAPLRCCVAAHSLTDQEIESNVVAMLFAGHDTSSATLALALAHLTNHPRAMQRLREEQQQVVAAHGSTLDATALRSMPYAEAVIRWVGGWVGGWVGRGSHRQGQGQQGWQQLVVGKHQLLVATFVTLHVTTPHSTEGHAAALALASASSAMA
jgi:hypothetical protein